MNTNKSKDALQKEYNLLKNPVPKNAQEKSDMEDIILNNFTPSSSSTDCTGLVPHGRESDKNQNSYRDVYPHAVPVENKMHGSQKGADKASDSRCDSTPGSTYGKRGTHGGV